MADAASRREARRKRILENSHNRLQLIAGKNSDENSRENITTVLPEVFESDNLTEINVALNHSIPNGGIETGLQSLSEDNNVVVAGSGDRNDDFITLHRPAGTESISASFWWQILVNKYDIVLLGLLLQMIHSLFSTSMENNLFFIPLVLYGITKSIWLPKKNNSSIGNILLLLNLNGINSSTLHTLLHISQWLATFSQEACIFLFVTVCSQALLIVLKENFVT
ncbi:hypothetical protein ACJJTC_002548 [Scirpophaga incertulas]